MSTQSTNSLIKKLQTVLSDIAPDSAVDRLLEHIVQREGMLRAVLITENSQIAAPHEHKSHGHSTSNSHNSSQNTLHNNAMVQAIAVSEPDLQVQKLNVPLSIMRSLPVDVIHQCQEAGELRFIERADLDSPVMTTLQSAACHPVESNGKVVGVIYIESSNAIGSLKDSYESLAAFWDLAPVWLLSSMEQQKRLSLEAQYLEAAQALKTSEAYLQALMEYAPALISVRDMDGRFVLASKGFDDLMSYSGGMVGKTIFDVLSTRDAKFVWELDQQVAREKKTIEYSREYIHRVDGRQSYQVSKFPLIDEEGDVFAIADVLTNISEHVADKSRLQEQQVRLNRLAYNDLLTNLPNRTLFFDRLRHAIVRSNRQQSQVAVMLLDVDRFKNVNDSLGHDAGDIMLQTLGRRFSREMRDSDTLARFGGDEFVVIIEGLHGTEDAAHIATKLLEVAAKPLKVCDRVVNTSVSLGVSIYPDDGDDAETLIKHADLAMYKAKEEGKDCFHFYQEGMNQAAVDTLTLEGDLRRAIAEDQLFLHYQPQVSLSRDELSGVEALVRWQHPGRGVIPPFEFIGLAEEAGLIDALGDWVLREACRQMKEWLDNSLNVPKVAVNISLRQLKDTNFVRSVQSVLQETGLDAKYLEIEITESSAMENADQTIGILAQLSDMGISLSIDDFGTGYSSLAYLKRFPINKLKIDRSFVCEITQDSTDEAIANSIVALAHSMNLVVVAEGVERKEEANVLRSQGCDHAQGFLFARPLSNKDFEGHFHYGEYRSRA